MRLLVLIMSLVLSLSSGGKTSVVIEPQRQDDYSINHEINHDICLTTASGYVFSGHNGSNSVSVRTTHSGHRTSPQNRSNSRIVKSGKIIDNNNTHPFLTSTFIKLSGANTSERYLYSICRLRL